MAVATCRAVCLSPVNPFYSYTALALSNKVEPEAEFMYGL